MEAYQEDKKEFVVLVTTTRCEPRSTTDARQVVSKAVCRKTALVCTPAAGVIEVTSCADMAKNPAYIMAKGIMYAFQGSPFYNSNGNFGIVEVHLPKTQKLARSRIRPRK